MSELIGLLLAFTAGAIIGHRTWYGSRQGIVLRRAERLITQSGQAMQASRAALAEAREVKDEARAHLEEYKKLKAGNT